MNLRAKQLKKHSIGKCRITKGNIISALQACSRGAKQSRHPSRSVLSAVIFLFRSVKTKPSSSLSEDSGSVVALGSGMLLQIIPFETQKLENALPFLDLLFNYNLLFKVY